ncbi:MAG: thioredoxin domain-containing protein [Dehalococcoidia bacterium]|nr:thioredoxin domain-containing protein [Dehalococcoidia bacterium]
MHTNRLAKETSPYLLQHAHNPVDWYPWGDEALGRARREDRPILLSVGYSACHWCHVMERECFENEEIARLMNEHFVCIKVDREERPDIDHVYMEAVQAMTGGGGWPLTVFLTPEGHPFYGGTYFPPEDRYGTPGFPRVLVAVSEAYRNRRTQVNDVAREVVAQLSRSASAGPEPADLTQDILTHAFQVLEAGFDDANGGFGPGPKFPQAPVLEFLLQYHHRMRSARALAMVELTLERMARGGIYDHIGGGFHRYATDAEWMVPHFEKMLYDNALLSRVYLHAYQVTGKADYRRVAEETLDYLLREMTHPAGGFFSSLDADVDGEEGGYYTWSRAEMNDALGEKDGHLVGRFFGVGSELGLRERSVLHIRTGLTSFAAGMGGNAADVEKVIARSKARLREARERRRRPQRDDKILASWNGLTLQALAEAGGVLDRKDYVEGAAAAATFILGEMVKAGVLMHSCRDGVCRIPGYLDDYASVIRGLLDLHGSTLESRWLQSAVDLTGAMLTRFGDREGACLLYDTAPDHDTLFARARDTSDSVKPCGGSSAADVLLRVSRITGDESYEKMAVAMLRLVRDQMLSYPLASGNWLCALDMYLSDGEEVFVVGRWGDAGMESLLSAIHSQYRPRMVVAGLRPGEARSAVTEILARGRGMMDSGATAYLCRGRSCLPPATEPEELRRLLGS